MSEYLVKIPVPTIGGIGSQDAFVIVPESDLPEPYRSAVKLRETLASLVRAHDAGNQMGLGELQWAPVRDLLRDTWPCVTAAPSPS